MEKKWTPGPWEVVEHSWSDTSISSDMGRICELSIYYETAEDRQEKSKSTMKANAHLIAAAPELYEALENLLSAVENNDYVGSKWIEEASDALAKARGE